MTNGSVLWVCDEFRATRLEITQACCVDWKRFKDSSEGTGRKRGGGWGGSRRKPPWGWALWGGGLKEGVPGGHQEPERSQWGCRSKA